MGRKMIIVSGALALLAILLSGSLHAWHSPLADFVKFVCFPFFSLVFICSVFLVRLRRSSVSPMVRVVIGCLRVLILAGFAVFVAVVCWPRSYGGRASEVHPLEGLKYWDLSTGSRIAYMHIPGAAVSPKPCPIIYLQGGPGGSFDRGLVDLMRPLAAEGYDVYLYDQIGSGWSGRLPDIRAYSAERHKRDLEEIVKRIGDERRPGSAQYSGAEKVILIGQSWGAILAVLFAADNQGLVSKLIVTGPGPIQPVNPSLAAVPSPDSLHLQEPNFSNRDGNLAAANIRMNMAQWMALTFGLRLVPDREADAFAGYRNKLVNRSTMFDSTLARESVTNARPAGSGPAGYYVQVMTVQSFLRVHDPRPALRGNRIPILAMKGQRDNQQWGFTHEYLDLFPNHRLVVVPGAGHGIFIEQRAVYLMTIKAFLDSN